MDEIELLKLNAKLDREIRDKAYAEKLRKLGLQFDLEELYKPLIKSQKDIKDTVVDKLKISNDSWRKLETQFNNFPTILGELKGMKNELAQTKEEILNKVEAGDESYDDIEKFVEKEERLNNLYDTLAKYPKVVLLLEKLETSPSFTHAIINGISDDDTLSEQEKELLADIPNLSNEEKEALDKYLVFKVTTSKPIVEETIVVPKKSTEIVEDTTVSFLKKLKFSTTKEKDFFMNQVNEPENRNKLLEYVKRNPELVKEGRIPWNRIKANDESLWIDIMDIKKATLSKRKEVDTSTPIKGKGFEKIAFLPSSKNELIAELKRLLGSYQSGNTAVFNELNAVVDELRRKGYINLAQSKLLYKYIS